MLRLLPPPQPPPWLKAAGVLPEDDGDDADGERPDEIMEKDPLVDTDGTGLEPLTDKEIEALSHDQLIARVKASPTEAWRTFADQTLRKYDPSRYPTNYLVIFLTGGELPERDRIVNKVKTCEQEKWKVFCDKTLKKYDPRCYPDKYLSAFLDGDDPPPIYSITEDLMTIDKNDLVARTKLAMKQGAEPLVGRWKDPAMFSENDLRLYLYKASGEEPPSDLVSESTAARGPPDGVTNGGPMGTAGMQLSNVADNIDTVPRSELIQRAKAAVKMGAPALQGRGRDPARYSEEELVSYLTAVATGDHAGEESLVPPGMPSSRFEGPFQKGGRARGGKFGREGPPGILPPDRSMGMLKGRRPLPPPKLGPSSAPDDDEEEVPIEQDGDDDIEEESTGPPGVGPGPPGVSPGPPGVGSRGIKRAADLASHLASRLADGDMRPMPSSRGKGGKRGKGKAPASQAAPPDGEDDGEPMLGSFLKLLG